MTTAATTLRYDDVQVGDEVPTLVIPLTRTLIVATAIALSGTAIAVRQRFQGQHCLREIRSAEQLAA